MEKIIERNLLFDFYGDLLTERQRNIYQDLVYGDLSLSELADDYGISRQGVHDLIRRCDKTLEDYENKLHLIDRFGKIRRYTDMITAESEKTGNEEVISHINDYVENINKLL